MKFFLVFLSFAVVFAFFLFPVTDFDIWFHLADGKFIAENLKAPTTDIYSYTAYGQPAHTNSWGFAAFSYLTFKIAGLEGLNFIKALVSFLIFLVIILYLKSKKLLNLAALIFVVLALFSIRENFSLRPHTFSYLIFVIFLIFLFKYQESKKPKYILILTAIQLFWVNFHASFIWGIAFSGIILVSETVKNKKLNKLDLILFGSILISSCLNLFYGPAYLFRVLTGYVSSFNAPIREHLPPTFKTFLSLLGFILLSLIPVVYFSLKKKKFDILLMTATLLLIALTNGRFLRDLVLFICLTAPAFFQKIQMELPRPRRGGASLRASSFSGEKPRCGHAALRGSIPDDGASRYSAAEMKKFSLKLSEKTLTIFSIVVLFAIFLATKNNPLGIKNGLQNFTYPVGTVEFIKKEGLLEKTGGNLYNTYNFGGYLIWNLPEHKVFVDGRMEPYEKVAFQIYWDNFEGGLIWQQSVEKYKITAALMTLPHTDGKKVYNDSTKMFPKDEWALIYYDDVAMLYVKRLDEIGDLIEKYEYKIINPQAMDFSYLQEAIQSEKGFNEEEFNKALAEIKKGLEINPESYRLHFTLSYLYNLAGKGDLLKMEIEKTLEINPYFKPARQILEQLINPVNS
ncbi:MAG: hypothetical protein COX90_03085 [Candidatus Nealsonbacteria bacterium CG_4_10_14_0_2_um_filter_38_17]|uniref:Uncharacterized protein n=2 Tax=Candidatus Nealsoniibacteriota TaxID=1817911 RepID=A0A2M7UXK7_9BACT|nr:MAG: hypothetical protein COX36_03805 [Candidatus Nealsonbacteria bacterium CG23_combo_of_CG06-09_8_20_14_all_38_19]PIZ88721.1 MAG: hypothetical protein COX90_03085 [Candidatus Nealsonbacteria bacterium CG_4_10_14_0_2_um_filter_38_17]